MNHTAAQVLLIRKNRFGTFDAEKQILFAYRL